MDILKNLQDMQKTIKVLGPLFTKYGSVVSDVILALEDVGLYTLPPYVRKVLEIFDSKDDDKETDPLVVEKTIGHMADAQETFDSGDHKLKHVVEELVEDKEIPEVKEETKDKVINTVESILSIAKLF